MLTLRRRQLLQSLAAGATLSLPSLGCSSGDEIDGESLDALEGRAEALLGVKKIVILMMENRSFDHYFGHLTIPRQLGGEGLERYSYAGGTPQQREGDRRVNGLTGKEWNPKKPGGAESDGVRVFHAHEKDLGYGIGDINHEWVECHAQWNPVRVAPGEMPAKGEMNGFVIEHLRDRGELGELGPAWSRACDSFPDICAQGSSASGERVCAIEPADKTPEAKLAACGHPDAPMAYYKRADTPIYHAFYDRFVLCDNWYSSVCGPTWPNRYYVHSGTAGAAIGTKPARDARHNLDSIFKVLEISNIDYYNFFSDAPLVTAMYGSDAHAFQNKNRGMAKVFEGQSPADRLFADAARASRGSLLTGSLRGLTNTLARDDSFEKRCRTGTLPPVSYIEPPYFVADDHPPHDILLGQAFVKSIYDMLYGRDANREQANSTLLVIMYDEHGSFYDHQDPGLAYRASSGGADADRNFKPLGFRVPAMLVGPMVKRAHVSHTIYDHSSVLRTIYNWALVHAEAGTGVLGDFRAAQPQVGSAQTQEMIDEVYRAGFPRNHPLRPLHAQRYSATGKQEGLVHKPMLRVLAANDLSDCLVAGYEPGRASMPELPQVRTREGRVLAGMQFSEGQAGIAAALGIAQPSFRGKVGAARVVMEHLHRLGAVDIG